jgi:hypothetical protein
VRSAAISLVAGGWFYLAIWHQQKFLFYHWVPAYAVAWVSASGLALRCARELPVPRSLRSAVLAIGFACPLLVIARGTLDLAERSAREQDPALVRSFREILRPGTRVMLMTPSVEGELFELALRSDLDILGPWTSNFTLPPLLRIADAGARERAIRAYFVPLLERIAQERPDFVLFSPKTEAMGGRTVHDLVTEYRLFPPAGYRLAGRTELDWILYAPDAGAAPS